MQKIYHTFSVLFSSDRSSSGKSTVTLSFAYKLKEMDISTMIYKIGPDFIDPIVLGSAVKTQVKNIDSFFIPARDLTPWIFDEKIMLEQNQAFIIEGAMGLYDGASYVIAKKFKIPVVLVMDCRRISSTMASLVYGLKTYKKGLLISGVILNNISSIRHYNIIAEEIKKNIKDIKVFGYILNNEKDISIKERRLGLVTPEQILDKKKTVDTIIINDGLVASSQILPNKEQYATVKKMVDNKNKIDVIINNDGSDTLNRILADEGLSITPTFESFEQKALNIKEAVFANIDINFMIKTLIKDSHVFVNSFLKKEVQKRKNEKLKEKFVKSSGAKKVKIAVAYDDAFLFYYNFNFEILKKFGAEIVFFSPLSDKSLPKGVKAIYIGGGYPEENANRLSENINLKNEIYMFFKDNGLIYAECGGLMYLCKNLIYKTKNYNFLDILPFTATMDGTKLTLGYRKIYLAEDSFFGIKGLSINGHEFHYSKLILNSETAAVSSSMPPDNYFKNSGYNSNKDSNINSNDNNNNYNNDYNDNNYNNEKQSNLKMDNDKFRSIIYNSSNLNNFKQNDVSHFNNIRTIFNWESPYEKGIFHKEGYSVLNAIGTYMHLSFFSNKIMAKNFIDKARNFN